MISYSLYTRIYHSLNVYSFIANGDGITSISAPNWFSLHGLGSDAIDRANCQEAWMPLFFNIYGTGSGSTCEEIDWQGVERGN